MWHEGWSSFEITFSWPFSLESDIPVSLNWEWTTWFERFLIFQDVVDRSILSPEDGKHQMDWINQGELEEGKRKRQFITLFVRNQCMARALLPFSLWRDFVMWSISTAWVQHLDQILHKDQCISKNRSKFDLALDLCSNRHKTSLLRKSSA